MLSIIICSRTQAISSNLSENIKNKIGCEYELIVIDNSDNAYSIFEAYNLGIDQSKRDFLCFIHDDILFHTKNWGLLVLDIFEQNRKLGLLGIAGAKTKTKIPSAWWECPESEKLLYLKQHLRNGSIEDWNVGFRDKNLKKAVVIDGVLMIARRDNRFRFQKSLKGFHGYDLNIAFEYIQLGYEIMVSNLILVEHFSLGKMDKDWYFSTLQIHKLYSNILPLKTKESILSTDFEFINGSKFIKGLLFFRYKREAFLLWLQLIVIKPFSRFHLNFIQEILK